MQSFLVAGIRRLLPHANLAPEPIEDAIKVAFTNRQENVIVSAAVE
jgi:hypothetical protein